MIDIAIIGGGAAGLTAGMYAARGGCQVTVFESFLPGGQSAKIRLLENYPGFAQGVSGVDFVIALQEQASRFGVQFCYESITGLQLQEEEKAVISAKNRYPAQTVIIATGASPRKIGLEGEERLTGKGVSYCATCDGALYRDQPVAVVGGGDTALTDALVLANYASRVYLIHRRDAFRGSYILQQRVKQTANIETIMSHVPRQLIGEDKLQGLVLQSTITDLQRTLPIAGLFVAVGINPQTEFLQDQLELSGNGAIIVDEKMAASRPGVYAAGDCRDTPLRQVVTAAADGAIAATSAIEYLLAQGKTLHGGEGL